MFDDIALTYDREFTFSNIGKILRHSVWDYMENLIGSNAGLKILELNCGTGEDAVWFARKGHFVMATDFSEQMVKAAYEKVKINELLDRITTKTCDMRNIEQCDLEAGYDLVFSNFGGLNCLNGPELERLSADLFRLLKPGGRFISVVMPRFCVWESLYFLAKFDCKKIFRRNTGNSLQVRVGEKFVNTWYYSPRQFQFYFSEYFEKIAVKPVGLAIPPSYMEKSIGHRQGILSGLWRIEKNLMMLPVLANVSDHFLMDMVKKNN